jgi:hypothetical protein
MFDPNKYDNTNSQDKKSGNFMDKRTQIIKYLSDLSPVIIKECEMLESYIKNNPESKAVGPFSEKLDGWSRILNGLNILKDKYEVV